MPRAEAGMVIVSAGCGFQDASRNVLKELDGMVGVWGVSKIKKRGLTIASEF